jgi:hypothetical protein
MKNSFNFKKESTAKEFAKELCEDGAKALAVGSSVEVESDPMPSFNDVHEMISSYSEYYERELRYMYKYMSRIQGEMYSYMWEHEKGHLPSINDAGRMEKALNILGLGESYEVRKPTISVAKDSSGSKVLEFE